MRVMRFARRQPLGAASALILALVMLVAVFAPFIAPYNPNALGDEILALPSPTHPAGTDQFGRDILSRVVIGARTSITIGLVATGLTTLFAVALGVLGGYFGGLLDLAIQRAVDVVQSFPLLILLLLIVAVFGNTVTNVILALVFSSMWRASRIVRAQVLSVMNEPYVEAARSLGGTNFHLMLRHILPNIMPVVIIITSLGIGGVILAEASLAFLGLGVPPPTPTWGRMMSTEGRDFMLIAPWIVLAPTLALTIVVWSFNIFGDALRDVMDPRLRGAR